MSNTIMKLKNLLLQIYVLENINNTDFLNTADYPKKRLEPVLDKLINEKLISPNTSLDERLIIPEAIKEIRFLRDLLKTL